MKKIFYFITSSLILLSCSNIKKAALNLDDSDLHKIQINQNQIVKLKVKTNPSTGFSWITNIEEQEGIKLVDQYTEKINNDPNVVGAPVYQFYRIKGIKRGTYNLTFNYARSWETNQNPSNTKQITLKVN